MTDFPTIPYKVPGPHRFPGYGGYDSIACADASELEKLKNDGWYLDRNDAVKVLSASTAIDEVKEAKEAVETADRKSLEMKAKELGVSFNARTKDEVLAKRIAEAA